MTYACANEPFLEIHYGCVVNIKEDVEAFKRFYIANFSHEALALFAKRRRRESFALFLACAIAGLLMGVPVMINPETIFAYIILAMGVCVLALGIVFLIKSCRAAAYCERNFDRLIEDEFAATSTETKRVFNLVCTSDGVSVSFGGRTGVKQNRFRPYREIRAVYVNDELAFIKGITWVCRSQIHEEAFEQLVDTLAANGVPIFREKGDLPETEANSRSDAPPVAH